MRPISHRDHHRPKRLLRRFDHTVSQLNPYLLAIAFGLGVLYITCLFTLMVRLPAIHVNVCVRTPASSAASDVAPK
jgi:hypothetical protein